MSPALAVFREMVFADAELLATLAAERDNLAFPELVSRLASGRGLAISVEEVAAAIREGRQQWHQRKI